MSDSDAILESQPEPGHGMEHPHVAALLQARIDAALSRGWGGRPEEYVPRIVARMKFLFGDDIPVRRVERVILEERGDAPAVRPT